MAHNHSVVHHRGRGHADDDDDETNHDDDACKLLREFLRAHVANPSDGRPCTHTNMRKGAYFIDDPDDVQVFFKLYSDALDAGADLHITERHRSISPIVIDLDFRYNPGSIRCGVANDNATAANRESEGRGIITDETRDSSTNHDGDDDDDDDDDDGDDDGDDDDDEEEEEEEAAAASALGPGICPRAMVIAFVEEYMRRLHELVVLPPEVCAYVFTKDTMEKAKNGMVKDGVHIVFPDVVTDPSIQFVVRQMMLPVMRSIFNGLALVNSHGDVFDKNVVCSSPWTLYGSKKPESIPYKVRYVVRFASPTQQESDTGVMLDTVEDIPDPSAVQPTLGWVRLFSIRNKPFATPTTALGESKVDEYNNSSKTSQVVASAERVAPLRNTEDAEFIKRLVDLLDAHRHEQYDAWVQVGLCLHNIEVDGMFDLWVAFSRKSAKFEEGQCEEKWRSFANRREGSLLTIATLHYWAKLDNPQEYREVVKDSVAHLMMMARSGCEVPVARVVYHMYKYTYKCVSILRKQWYEFRGHRWVACDSGYTLRRLLSEDVSSEFARVAEYFANKASAEEDEGKKEDMLKTHKQLSEISLKLQTRRFLDNVMHECCPFFYDADFESSLDEQTHLIGFENGVYDLSEQCFRAGHPDDRITFSTKVDYISLDESCNDVVAEIRLFFEQVFVNKNVREYFLTMLASFLHGEIKFERFHIFTAGGSNGKSKTIELFERSFGEYCVKLPVALLTQKRVASNSATSEIARTKGKRFACLQEPGEDEKLNVGLMKELSGGDVIQARALYREPVEFKPQFKLVLVCNHLPHVPSQDYGTWRRMRVIQFLSRFCESPQAENEFPIDIDLSKKISKWRKYFLSFLLQEYYHKYYENGLVETEEIMSYTQQYQQASDHIAQLIDECLVECEGSFVEKEVVHNFYMASLPKPLPRNYLSCNQLAKYLAQKLGPLVQVGTSKGWKGWKAVEGVKEDDEDGDVPY